MTALAMPGADAIEGGRPPSGLGRLAWVTWRQHRGTLIALAGFMAVVAGCGVMTALWSQGSISDPAGNCNLIHQSIPCQATATIYSLVVPFTGLLVPLAIGLFLGAPLLAREYSTGTARFAWTQDVGRARQTTVKLILLGLAVAVAAAAVGWVTWWATQLSPGQEAQFSLEWIPVVFSGTALTGATSALAGYAAGVLAGALTRRVVPAMVATATVIIGLGQLGLYGRPYYWLLGLGARQAPDQAVGEETGIAHVASPHAPGGRVALHIPYGRSVYATGNPVRWVDQGWYTDAHGHPLRGAALTRVLQHPAQLTRLHDTFWVSYQPASRFWLFQTAWGGAELLIALLLGALAVWLIQRRAG